MKNAVTSGKCLSIIYPAYNEAGNLRELMEKTDCALKRLGVDAEVIIIDDCSRDRTGDIAEELRRIYPYLSVIHHSRRRGITRSLADAFACAKGNIFLFLCADLQSNPEEDIPTLYKGISDGYDMVLGQRKGRTERKVRVSRVYHLLARFLFGVRFHDMNWIKAFRREVIKNMPMVSDWHRYMAVIAAARGYRITEIRMNYYPRKYGKSKFGPLRIITGLLDLIAVRLYLCISRNPSPP